MKQVTFDYLASKYCHRGGIGENKRGVKVGKDIVTLQHCGEHSDEGAEGVMATFRCLACITLTQAAYPQIRIKVMSWPFGIEVEDVVAVENYGQAVDHPCVETPLPSFLSGTT